MNTSNGKKSTGAGDYNPIQGDILSFLNEVTKQHKEQHQSGKEPQVVAVEKKEVAAVKSEGKGRGLNMASEEAFPALGAGISTQVPVWGNGPIASHVHQPRTVSQTFELAFEQQKPLRSESRDKPAKTIGQVCTEIGSRTHTTIDASTSNKTRAMTFIIRGRPGDVAEAKKMLWSEVAQSMSSSIEVPEAYLGSIIGASGRTVQAIMQETGTKINVPRKSDDSSYPGYIMISGDYEAIAQAKARILAIVDEKAKKVVEKVELKAHLLPFIYGVPSSKVNEQVQTWSERHSIRISQDVDRDADHAVVTFSGDRDEVQVAHREFLRLLEEQKRAVKSVSTSLSKPLHKFLIGPKGSILHDLEAETGCEIQVPRPDSPSDQVTVYGPQEKLFKGLSAVMEKTGSMASELIRIQPNLRILILERHRAKINDLQNSIDVSIVPVAEGLQVNGFKNKVPAAITELESIIKPLMGWKFDGSLTVDTKYFGHIIGKKGHKLKEIESQCGASVLIPQGHDNATQQAILIAGPTDESIKSVKAVLNEMLSVLKDYLSVEMRVESKYHRALIGKGGSALHKYSEAFPTVAIFFEGDSATIKGRAGEVQAAQAMLKEDLDALKHDSIMHAYTTTIEMSPEQAKHLLFKKSPARWVIAIAQEHDVHVSVDATGKVLEVQGLKKMAEEARKAIIDRCVQLENQGSVSVDLDHSMHSALIGRGGKNVKHLDKKYQVHLSFPEPTDTENHTIVISGPKANLAAAKSELVGFYEHLIANANSEELSIPQAALPRLMGKGGANIESIRLDSSAKIDVGARPTDDETPVSVTLSGTVEAIEAASKAIQAIVVAVEAEATEFIPLTTGQCETLHGIASSAYFRISDSHADVTVALQPREPRILVRGPKDQVPSVVLELSKLVSDLSKFVCESVEIPSSAHGEIIGQAGKNIRKLSSDLKVKIDLPRQGTTVKVSGLSSDVQSAIAQLKTFIKDERKVAVESRALRQAVADSLALEHPAVKFMAVRDGIVVRGPTADLDTAFAALTLCLSPSSTRKFYESIEVPKHQHGLLVGPGGATAKAIREASGGCTIELPPKDSADAQVKLFGSPEAIAKAKLEIERILAN